MGPGPPNKYTVYLPQRLMNLDVNAKSEAGMVISIPKTKVQHIMKQPRMPDTTEEDIMNLPPEMKFKFVCDNCEMSYPTKARLNVHKGRWCGKRKSAAKKKQKGNCL